MRILWFYKYIKSYDFDNWLHMKYVEKLAQHPGVTLMAYGPDLHHCNPELVPVHYRPDMDMFELFWQLKPDVIICNTKSRMFMYYSPHQKREEGLWLPKNFVAFEKVPKIMIEEDYHYEENDNWYHDLGFNLILQRHWGSAQRQHRCPMRWFPFSVDTKVFCPPKDPNHKRVKKICMAGSVNGAYPERQVACRILRKAHLLDEFSRKEMIGQKYVDCLRNYVCHLSGASQYKITPAKMFEIMASGSILLTNENEDLHLLFDRAAYVTYRSDYSRVDIELIRIVRRIIENDQHRQTIIDAGMRCIRENHTHEHRNTQLIKIIEDLKSSGPIKT
jgi:hypothetical protein